MYLACHQKLFWYLRLIGSQWQILGCFGLLADLFLSSVLVVTCLSMQLDPIPHTAKLSRGSNKLWIALLLLTVSLWRVIGVSDIDMY